MTLVRSDPYLVCRLGKRVINKRDGHFNDVTQVLLHQVFECE